MATIYNLERYIPGVNGDRFSFSSDQVSPTTLNVKGRVVPHLETKDFPISDPWSVYLREILGKTRDQGVFTGQPVTEFGIGDGRNVRVLGLHPTSVLGVDVENWRVGVAGANLTTDPDFSKTPLELWSADAVDFLQESKKAGNRINGWVVMCLPQSPDGLNTADKYDRSPLLNDYRRDWEAAGLTLNAAVLDNLRSVVDPNLRALIILSDRVPKEIREELFIRTGWQVEQRYVTEFPIQQDPDTGIGWVAKIDDGQGFYEAVSPDQYFPISAIEAETRRLKSFYSGLGRFDLNVYHHLNVYQVKGKIC